MQQDENTTFVQEFEAILLAINHQLWQNKGSMHKENIFPISIRFQDSIDCEGFKKSTVFFPAYVIGFLPLQIQGCGLLIVIPFWELWILTTCETRGRVYNARAILCPSWKKYIIQQYIRGENLRMVHTMFFSQTFKAENMEIMTKTMVLLLQLGQVKSIS